MNDKMGDAFRAGENQTPEAQTAQIAEALKDLEARGFHKIKGPILQLVRTRSRPGRRDALLGVLKNFQKHVDGEKSTLCFGFFADLSDPDIVHSIQIYEDWEGLRHHMIANHYFEYLDAILENSIPEAITYEYGSNLFLHQSKGRKG
jgi:quinol monooxygenase YgiN